MNEALAWFVDHIPTWTEMAIGGPIGLGWALLGLSLAGYLKKHKGWKTGYTRKVFHFFIFGSVAFIQVSLGTTMVCLFGGMTSLVVFYAVLRGEGNMLYEAMAREKDAPKRTYYVIAPYFATLIGGVAANIFFGLFSLYGYLVVGIADAIAEPVGTRFGKHPYKVPTFHGLKLTRTLEGSTAVFLGSLFALLVGNICLTGEWQFNGMMLGIVAVLTLLEAVSPHGWDNFVLQLAAAGLVWWGIAGG